MNKRRLVVYTVLVLIAAWAVLPPLLTLQASFMMTYAFANPLRAHYTLNNWSYLPYVRIVRWALNSVIVCGTSTIGGVQISIMAGYGFAHHDFRWKETIFWLFLLGMMMPVALLFLPRFLIVRQLGMMDSPLGMIAPMLIYPAGIFLSRQYLAEISVDLLDAARIDGAGEMRILWTIILPLSKPLIAILTLFIFIYTWQQFMWQFLITQDVESMTLIVGLGSLLRGILGGGATYGLSEQSSVSLEGLQAASSVILAVVPITVFMIGAGRRRLMRGLTMGSVKG